MMLSKSALNRVGKRLRDAETPNPEDVAAYAEYQAEFGGPTQRVARDLFESMKDLDALRLSTRLKKIESVIAKLRRHDTQLATIEDIGGVRMIVPTLHELDLAKAELRGYDIVRYRDYLINARDGYRALHLIIRVDQRHRIELQLRTEIQNEWANVSEVLHQAVHDEIKYGGGPSDIRAQLNELSNIGHHLDGLRTGVAHLSRGYVALRRGVESELLGSVAPQGELEETIDNIVRRMPEMEILLYAGIRGFKVRRDALREAAEGSDAVLRSEVQSHDASATADAGLRRR